MRVCPAVAREGFLQVAMFWDRPKTLNRIITLYIKERPELGERENVDTASKGRGEAERTQKKKKRASYTSPMITHSR